MIRKGRKMQCPNCQNTMNTIRYENVEIDVCTGCAGVWLDDKEIVPILRSVDEKFTVEEKAEAHATKGQDHRASDQQFCCPICMSTMDVIPYAYNSGVMVDRCPNNHGLWLDKGELEKIQILMQDPDNRNQVNLTYNEKKLCPVDHTPLEEVAYETETIDRCPTCEGVWCDHTELQGIIESKEMEFGPNEFKNILAKGKAAKTASGIDVEPGYNCAVCNEEMQRLNFSYNSGIIIDHCRYKHGVWLDNDELERIQAFSELWSDEVDKNSEIYVARLQEVAAAATDHWEREMQKAYDSGKELSWLGRKLDFKNAG